MIIDISDIGMYEPDVNYIYDKLDKAKNKLKLMKDLLNDKEDKLIDYNEDAGILDYTTTIEGYDPEDNRDIIFKYRIVAVSLI